MKRCITLCVLVLSLCCFGTVRAEPLVLVAPEYPPQIVADPAAPFGVRGAAVEIVAEAMRRTGLPFEIRPLPWARGMHLVKDGSVDGIINVYWKPDRAEFLDFCSEELFHDRVSFFATDRTLRWDGDIRLLAGKSVGVVLGYSYGPIVDDALRRGLFSRVVEYYSVQELMNGLISGKVQLIPSDYDVAFTEAEKIGMSQMLNPLGLPVENVSSFLAFSRLRKLTAVRDRVDCSLREMHKDGTIASIIKRYFRKIDAGS
ncbi:transporter substrate-binding domain-containing protein [Desulfovibrio mangrovi]|uniref:substrate-binding periplasmic protein n=1 Tax=Desulfovibrio mangrovi TaxID=2976983 RepID=UPI0022471298|nr:transporter substrate-binding domain-containing protein [Desulfovibrio mangrovi]UZP68953.1 transporter substrate-binding domain-containing protein [Desulfovibrio mangrovi]